MNLEELTAISPLDGRYRNKTEILSTYFSEYALIKYRVMIEIEYFIALCRLGLPQLNRVSSNIIEPMRNIYKNFSITDALEIKKIERTTNHDVKAVEYFLRDKFTQLGLEKYLEFIHFGLTSQDINNTAIPKSLKDFCNEVFYKEIQQIIDILTEKSQQWHDIPLLAHTHGQPASPTKVGKEIAVFVERLSIQFSALQIVPFSAKFGGATGNFNAHVVAYPLFNWVEFGNAFVNSVLELERSQTTTQIEHYDNFAAFCDACKRINTILIDFCRDIWTYISMEYFKQKIVSGEVGSSAMPHKVNPIDFENAEGNLGVANALFEHFAAKLPISRLQRDLTDSTVLRNIGVPLGHTLIAFASIKKGISKLELNETKIQSDLEKNWVVVSEALQTILRRENYPHPYEVLKQLTRNNSTIDKKSFEAFIDTLNVPKLIKEELKAVTPFNYTGV
ncbi:MAG: adenylosuccinate lyase [Bacteroidales bacterium]